MNKSNQQLHTRTPTVMVRDNRGSTIREISYCRHPDAINQTDERITRHHYHARGYLERSIDARLYESQQSDSAIQSNIQQIVSLGGALSFSKGIDNGNHVNLNDIEGTVAQQINGKGTVTTYEYSDQRFERYLEQVKEGTLGESSIAVVQKFKWGQGSDEGIAQNQVGKCIEHYDTAGKKTVDSFSLLGAVLSETQQLYYGSYINWDSNNEEASIERAEKFTTQYTYDATGAVLEETDARGNKRRIAYDIAGFVKQSWLTLKGQSEQTILRSLSYSAAGQKLREENGNGLVTTYEYEPETQRLLHVKTQRPQGHVLGAKIMQDLRYEYDPVGNIICLKNDAEATRYWRNQKIVPENRYVYDSLYQLVSATGRESANQQTPASMQSQTITTLVKDAQSYTNYTRLYAYDRGGNLTQIRHNSAIAQQNFTQDITVSNKTNRALLKSQCSEPQNVDSYFDESGNLIKLLNGDAIIWDSRNHLKATNDISEGGHFYEGETYQYNSASQRMTKIRGRKTANGHLEIVTTHYLPHIEIWEVNDNPVTEKYAVVSVKAGTSAKVRALCWEIGTPKGIENNSLRYSYDDGVGNCGLETDGQGQLVSYEEYYPYGGTAIWSSENAVEADYKTIRYSGKEKDSTGMYYYGYRYYQPWIGRWLSADPAGTIDGLNLYRMVCNNPVTLHDPDGRQSTNKDANLSKTLPELHSKERGDLVYGLAEARGKYVKQVEQDGTDDSKTSAIVIDQYNNMVSQTITVDMYLKGKQSYLAKFEKNSNKKGTKLLPYEGYQDAVKKARKHYPLWDKYFSLGEENNKFNVTSIYKEVSHNLKSSPYHEWYSGSIGVLGIVPKLLWKRGSKLGIAMAASGGGNKIHFVLDDLNLNEIANKSAGGGQSITASELRYAYRHRAELGDNILFYKDGINVSSPWEGENNIFTNYKPKSLNESVVADKNIFQRIASFIRTFSYRNTFN